MSQLQNYQSAFHIDFPIEIADQVLARMQALYGKAFDEKYKNIDPRDLQITVCTVLNGLEPMDLRRGLERMNSEKWCPSLPEFRSWCEQGGEWWTAEMAWAKALNFLKDDETKISTLTKQALDEVKLIITTEGQKPARKAFIDIYCDYLAKAKKLKRMQVMYVKPVRVEDKEETRRTGIPCPPELVAKIKGLGREKRI